VVRWIADSPIRLFTIHHSPIRPFSIHPFTIHHSPFAYSPFQQQGAKMTTIHGFEVLETREIPELNTKGTLYRHIATGAELLSL
jgi:hypothetical protein